MLILGTNKTDTFLEHLPRTFLLIDNGQVSDALDYEPLDLTRCSFNPLEGMNYLRATQFLEMLGAAFPQGENTLTKKNSDLVLLKALTAKRKTDRAKSLGTLLAPPNPKDNVAIDAYGKIERILLSPFLSRVLNRPTNFTLKGTIVARLDNSLASFDRFLLGNLLISMYKAHIVIPDFGFYACLFHADLTDRLTVGLNYLDEVPRPLRQALLLMRERHGCRTTYDDAVVLAQCAGLRPDPTRQDNPYNRFIDERMA